MRICQQLAVIGLFLLLSAPAASQVLLPKGVVVSADKMRNADEACDAKIADACLAIGFAEYRGMGRMVDMVRATAAFETACELGSGAGCEYLATFIAQVDSPPDAGKKSQSAEGKGIRNLSDKVRSGCFCGMPQPCPVSGYWQLSIRQGTRDPVLQQILF